MANNIGVSGYVVGYPQRKQVQPSSTYQSSSISQSENTPVYSEKEQRDRDRLSALKEQIGIIENKINLLSLELESAYSNSTLTASQRRVKTTVLKKQINNLKSQRTNYREKANSIDLSQTPKRVDTQEIGSVSLSALPIQGLRKEKEVILYPTATSNTGEIYLYKNGQYTQTKPEKDRYVVVNNKIIDTKPRVEIQTKTEYTPLYVPGRTPSGNTTIPRQTDKDIYKLQTNPDLVNLYNPKSQTAPKEGQRGIYENQTINLDQYSIQSFKKGNTGAGLLYGGLSLAGGVGKGVLGTTLFPIEFVSGYSFSEKKFGIPILTPSIRFSQSIGNIPSYAKSNPFEFSGTLVGGLISGKAQTSLYTKYVQPLSISERTGGFIDKTIKPPKSYPELQKQVTYTKSPYKNINEYDKPATTTQKVNRDLNLLPWNFKNNPSTLKIGSISYNKQIPISIKVEQGITTQKNLFGYSKAEGLVKPIGVLNDNVRVPPKTVQDIFGRTINPNQKQIGFRTETYGKVVDETGIPMNIYTDSAGEPFIVTGYGKEYLSRLQTPVKLYPDKAQTFENLDFTRQQSLNKIFKGKETQSDILFANPKISPSIYEDVQPIKRSTKSIYETNPSRENIGIIESSTSTRQSYLMDNIGKTKKVSIQASKIASESQLFESATRQGLRYAFAEENIYTGQTGQTPSSIYGVTSINGIPNMVRITGEEIKVIQPQPQIQTPKNIYESTAQPTSTSLRYDMIPTIKVTQLTTSVIITSPDVKTKPKSKIIQTQEQVQITQPIQDLFTPQVTSTTTRQIYQPISITKPKIDNPEKQKQNRKSSKDNNIFSIGYDVFVKRKGKYGKVNPIAYSKEQAINYGASIVGNTASASFKILPSTNRNTGFTSLRGNLSDFYQKGGVFIEKRSRRIKSSGELREITFKGIQSRKGKSIFNNFKKARSIFGG